MSIYCQFFYITEIVVVLAQVSHPLGASLVETDPVPGDAEGFPCADGVFGLHQSMLGGWNQFMVHGD